MTMFFLLFAERAARTTEGAFILHGILERISTKEVPTPEAPLTMPAMSIAFEIRDADATKDHAMHVALTHKETGKILFEQTFPVKASNDPANKLSGLLNFNLFPIKAVGTYEAAVTVDGTFVGKNSFLVIQN